MTTSSKAVALRLLKKQFKISKAKSLLLTQESQLRKAINQVGYLSEIVVHEDTVYTVVTNGVGGWHPALKIEKVCTVEDLEKNFRSR